MEHMQFMEFIFYGVPLILAGIGLLAWLLSTLADLWLMLRKSSRQDEADKANMKPLDRINADMHGTDRENARERILTRWRGLLTVLGSIILYAAIAWLIYGVVLLWRHFFGCGTEAGSSAPGGLSVETRRWAEAGLIRSGLALHDF